ncbi:MAG TPA: Maf family protein, partial [Armatimonadota bacterium]
MPLTRPLLLASASPRRAELLAQVGLAFRVQVAHVHEAPPQPAADILSWACQTASVKARAVARTLPAAPTLILGADTVVLLPQSGCAHAPLLHGEPVEVLGKPRDAEDAIRMLHALSGREHTVISAFALLVHPEGVMHTAVVATQVQFRVLTDDEIFAY